MNTDLREKNFWKFLSVTVIVLGLIFLAPSSFAAFSTPPCPPPNCNTEAPVDISAVDQAKAGGLAIVGNTLIATWPSSVSYVGDHSGIDTSTGGKMKVFGNLGVWGADEASGQFLDIRTIGSLGGKINVYNGLTTQGNLTILQPTNPGTPGGFDGGNLLIKPRSQAGMVKIGEGGDVDLWTYGDVIATTSVVTQYRYEYLETATTSYLNLATSGAVVLSAWPDEFVANRLTCDSSLTSQTCGTGTTYASVGSDPKRRYDLFVSVETTGPLCPSAPPITEIPGCFYYPRALIYLNTDYSAPNGGFVRGIEGVFSKRVSSDSIKAGNYISVGGRRGVRIYDDGDATFGGDIRARDLTVKSISAYSNISTQGSINASLLCIRDDCRSSWFGGNGSTNRLARWVTSSTLGTSSIIESGSNVTIPGLVSLGTAPAANVGVGIDGVHANEKFAVMGSIEVHPLSPIGSGIVFRDGTRQTTASQWRSISGGITFTGNEVQISNGQLINSLDNANVPNSGSTAASLAPFSLRFGGSDTGEAIFSNRSSGSPNRFGISFMTLFQTRMVIQQFGNVGIGTTDPLAKLHVSGGDLRVDGKVMANDYCDLNGNNCLFSGGGGGGGFTFLPTDNFLYSDTTCGTSAHNYNLANYGVPVGAKAVLLYAMVQSIHDTVAISAYGNGTRAVRVINHGSRGGDSIVMSGAQAIVPLGNSTSLNLDFAVSQEAGHQQLVCNVALVGYYR